MNDEERGFGRFEAPGEEHVIRDEKCAPGHGEDIPGDAAGHEEEERAPDDLEVLLIKEERRRITFNYIAPNIITSGNLMCGVLSILSILHGHPFYSGWLVFCAVFFDGMDGKVARSLGGGSQFGLEYDSLADVVSFGVAPAILIYSQYLVGFWGVSGALAVSFFAICAGLRLARFNIVTTIPKGTFQGLPSPAGGLFMVSFVIAQVPLPGAAAIILSIGTGALMVSNIPFANLKGIPKGQANRARFSFLFALIALAFIFLRGRAPLFLIAIYLISAGFRFNWSAWLTVPQRERLP
jgi:CDP-diacylglycerol--serine O-phosphatidyltransferase